MKKIKITIFSLLAMLFVAVLITACGKEKLPEIEPFEAIGPQGEEMVVFTLPKELNELSEEELVVYLETLTEEELKNIGVVLPDDSAQVRDCDDWLTLNISVCNYHWFCSSVHTRPGKFRLKKRWCSHPNGPSNIGYYQYRWAWVGCCN